MTRVLAPGGQLTTLERKVLRLAAQGLTVGASARALGSSPPAVQDARHRLIAKLGARNITHAVWVATLTGVIGRYPDCGDRAAYLRHLRRKETPCPACRAANARHGVAQRAGQLRPKQARGGP